MLTVKIIIIVTGIIIFNIITSIIMIINMIINF